MEHFEGITDGAEEGSSVEMKTRLPMGIESFKEIRRQKFYYVDKTALIRELLENWGKVTLFTRPRRFGKTLNMSMLKCFFEISCDKALFDGLEISRETQLCEEYQGKFPMISITLKGATGRTFDEAKSMLRNIIATEAMRSIPNAERKFDADRTKTV